MFTILNKCLCFFVGNYTNFEYIVQKFTKTFKNDSPILSDWTVPGIAAAAILCGMRGYRAISDWAMGLSPNARARFGCRYRNKKYIVPSESIIRDVLIRVDPVELDQALQEWNGQYGSVDESLAIDGKTMCNAIDEEGRQTHIMSAVGHQSGQCYTQKKWELSL